MSSSAIGFQSIVYGLTGPTGPIGPTGLTGPDGLTAGATGPIGPYAHHVLNIFLTGNTATVQMSDNTEYKISGNFNGPTANDYTKIIDVGDGTYSLLASGNNSSSFVMRGLSAYGSLVVTEDSEAIYIDSIYTPSSGSLDSFGLLNNTLVYLKQNNQISSTTIGVTSGNYYDGVLNFEKNESTSSNPKFSKLLPRSKVKYIQPTYNTETSQPVVLNVNDAGVFYIRTPNGISAFGGTFKPSEIVSFTLITESDDIWNFPSNVFFENGENYLTCGKSIVNLTSFDEGQSWYAVVAARGVDVDAASCKVRSLYGSCCYTGVTGPMCLDYTTKNQCDILSGTFNPLQSCDFACGSTFGVCCSNGQCIENTNYAECLAFGGKFLRGVTCGSFGADTSSSASNATRLCYDRCQNQKVACCKNGTCIGDEFTVIECEQINGGVAFAGKSCSEVDCCSQNVKIGACCKNQGCSQKTLLECKDSGGVFMGEGELCENVNCGCIGSPILRFGTCCYCDGTSQTCRVTTEAGCSDGIWTYDETKTENSVCTAQDRTFCANISGLNCSSGTGKCCACDADPAGNPLTICTPFTTPAQCAAAGGVWGQGVDCTSGCNPCTSNNGSPCGDCVQITPGIACKCSATGTEPKCIQVPDINNCPAGYSCTGSSTTCDGNPCNCTAGECLVRPEFNPISQCPQNTLPAASDVSFIINEASSSRQSTAKVNISPPGLNLTFNTHTGVHVKDYYIDVTGDGFHTSGINNEDLQFCIRVNLENLKNNNFSGTGQFDTTDNSVRIYLLRTWYPKFYAQNLAARKQLHFKDGFDPASTIDESIPLNTDTSLGSNTELPYWSYLSELDPSYSGTNNLLRRDVLNTYINGSGISTLNHYLNQNANLSFNTDTLRKELNCPLYGYNTRGKGICEFDNNDQNKLQLTDGTILNLGTISGLLTTNASTSNVGNLYPGPFETDHPRYYHSTDLGVRYNTTASSELPIEMQYPESLGAQRYGNIIKKDGDAIGIPGITYISITGIIPKSNYMLMNKTIPTKLGVPGKNYQPYFVNYGDPDKQLMTYRFNGYTDFGISKNIPGQTEKTYHQKEHVGEYIQHAILNNFSNLDAIHPTLRYNFPSSAAGHPLTMDYPGDFVSTTQGGSRPAYPAGTQEDESPQKLTKQSAIIFDSGVITKTGKRITHYNWRNESTNETEHINIAEPYASGVYNGAINDPLLPDGGDVSVTVGKYFSTTSTYIFCVKLKNYKKYILTPENAADATEALLYDEVGFDALTKKQFTNFINKLRLVVYVGAHEPTMVGVTYSNQNLLDDSSDKSIRKFGQNYLNYLIATDSGPSAKMSYTINIKDPDLCSGTNPVSPEGCQYCDAGINADYETNCYVLSGFRDLAAYIPGSGKSCGTVAITQHYNQGNGSGLGSFQLCCCGGCLSTGIFPICSCQETNPSCSCKGESSGRGGNPDIVQCFGSGLPACGVFGPNYCGSNYDFDLNKIIEKLDNQKLIYKIYTDWILIKAKPLEGYGTSNFNITDGFNVWNKNGICVGCNTSANNATAQTFRCGNRSDCIKDRCVFRDSSCNKGSVQIYDQGTDLDTVFQNIISTYNGQQTACISDAYNDYLGAFAHVNQGSCPTNLIGDSFQYKKVFINETDFICVPLDCLALDCSQYQDCSI
jgi:hypothetical protein